MPFQWQLSPDLLALPYLNHNKTYIFKQPGMGPGDADVADPGTTLSAGKLCAPVTEQGAAAGLCAVHA